jgi:hypothetical protein
LQLTTLGGPRSDALSCPESELSLGSSAESFFLTTRLLALSVLNGFPVTMALSNFCTSSGRSWSINDTCFHRSAVQRSHAPSSWASSRRARISRACSKLIRPAIPRSVSIWRMCATWALVLRPSSSRVHCFRTPHATTRD